MQEIHINAKIEIIALIQFLVTRTKTWSKSNFNSKINTLVDKVRSNQSLGVLNRHIKFFRTSKMKISQLKKHLSIFFKITLHLLSHFTFPLLAKSTRYIFLSSSRSGVISREFNTFRKIVFTSARSHHFFKFSRCWFPLLIKKIYLRFH